MYASLYYSAIDMCNTHTNMTMTMTMTMTVTMTICTYKIVLFEHTHK